MIKVEYSKDVAELSSLKQEIESLREKLVFKADTARRIEVITFERER
jgi:hypothetical protein